MFTLPYVSFTISRGIFSPHTTSPSPSFVICPDAASVGLVINSIMGEGGCHKILPQPTASTLALATPPFMGWDQGEFAASG